MQIVQYLKAAEYECVEASDAHQGLEQISDETDVAIVDIRMEPLDGFEFIQAVRANNLSTPVILVTGDQNPDILEKSSKWGVATVLMKPVQKDRLISMVSRTIEMAKRKR
jgi:DNA-binding NtrC family response regulator